ncbi:hypothetical protein HAX54_027598 [Datura stramonium]|uniref:Uncharacterized protein n=1 Tax=Datura stramonium TaxID=4076 RepID=A0ABS8V4A0_DATST|nr:hypothetical protein [Datura stramonium]
MESTLEVVLEKVLATEESVQHLWSKLLDLTTMVKSHEVIIQQLEERMNELAFQMETPIAANNTTQRKDIMDDDVLEWEMQEEAIEELIVDVFLKGEELEEIHYVYKEVKKGEKNWRKTKLANRRSEFLNRSLSAGRNSTLMDSSALKIPRRTGETTAESPGKSMKRRSTTDLVGRIEKNLARGSE